MGNITKKDNAFIYADKEQQFIRANRFMALATTIYYAYMIALLFVSVAAGIRSIGLVGMISSIILIASAVTWILFRRNPKSRRMRYILLAGLCLVSWIISFAYSQDFATIIGAFAIVCAILYFEIKFVLVSGIAYSATVLSAMLLKVTTGENLGDMTVIDVAFVCGTVILLFVMIACTTNVAKLFNDHSVGAADAEQARQKEIMNDVISVAEEVRKGTENAMEIINRLNESSEVVNGAMGDISSSTQTTADSIQTQTEMTQSIQDAINETLVSSENMVRVAQQSNELNQQNLELMGALKQQSEVIAETNGDVANSMKALQECTKAVKGIVDTIVSISSQTNLLALNASIESARAGEAGRGFAVVADEIRQLAEKTKQETENIARILDELTRNAANAANAVERSVEAASVQDDMIEKVSMSFEEMSRNVNGLITDIEGIDNMLANLSEANNQIVDNITYLSATTEEVTASSSQASNMTIENLSNAETARTELNNILSVSHQLDKYIQ